VVVTFGSSQTFYAGAAVFSDVTSLGTCKTASGSFNSSESITGLGTLTGGAVFDTVAVNTIGSVTISAPTSPQVSIWNFSSGSSAGAGSYALGAVTSVSRSWSTGTSVDAYGAVPLNPASTTTGPVTTLTAAPSKGGNVIRLKTARDVNNLGFHVYREQNGRKVRLNPALLAGSALLAGADTVLVAGSSYSWLDDLPGRQAAASYWVEEIDIKGKHTWHGPAVPRVGETPDSPGVPPVPLSRVGRGLALASHPVSRHASAPIATNPKPGLRPRAATGQQNLETQWQITSGQAIRIGVQSEGWYHIGLADLVAAGLDPATDLSTVQLFADGVEQPILAQSGAIEFYGIGQDSTWSDTRMYWLVTGSQPGKRVLSGNAPGNASLPATSFPYTVERKDRTVYFAALLNGDADNFFGPALSGDPADQVLNVSHMASSGAAQLQVTLQGASTGPHAVAVQLNGADLGMVNFAGQHQATSKFTLAAAQIHEGSNVVRLVPKGGDSDISLVDTVQLTYPHSYAADGDLLRFTVAGGQSAHVGGFSSGNIRVFDITDPAQVAIVPGTIAQEGSSFSVTMAAAGSGDRLLLAVTDSQLAQPVSIIGRQGSSWHAAQPGADIVMISHADFLPGLAALRSLRESQGYTVAAIDVQDLYDEFNFGSKSPQAIQDFLANAQAQWDTKPRFVLLVGDATFDPRNYLGTGKQDFMPTKLVATAYLETASDDWYADFNGDGIPQIAIGRLPARTPAEAAAMAGKIVAYDASARSAASNHVLVVADANDEDNNFESFGNAVQALLPKQMGVTKIYRGQMQSSAHSALIGQIDAGVSLVNYIGHGSSEVWGGDLFSSTDAAALSNAAQFPVFLSMSCLNGFFQDVYTTALAKALITAQDGAVAVWASSGLTESAAQAPMNEAFLQALYASEPVTLGEAAAIGKKASNSMDVRRTWVLFGDPATKLQ
jgi:hypothetical protein